MKNQATGDVYMQQVAPKNSWTPSPKFNTSPLKIGLSTRKVVLQTAMFQGRAVKTSGEGMTFFSHPVILSCASTLSDSLLLKYYLDIYSNDISNHPPIAPKFPHPFQIIVDMRILVESYHFIPKVWKVGATVCYSNLRIC